MALLTEVGYLDGRMHEMLIGPSMLERPPVAVTCCAPYIERLGRMSTATLQRNTSRPRITFTTQVDGVDTVASPVLSMFGGLPFLTHQVSQPTEASYVPPGQVEFLVYGGGVSKRTEVWGPYTIGQAVRISLDGDYPDGQDAVAYSETLTATNYYGTVTWTQGGAGLPPGLSFSAGVLSGTPTTPGTYTFTVSARDGWDDSIIYRDFTVTIAP